MTQAAKSATGFGARRIKMVDAPSVQDEPVRMRPPSVRQVQDATKEYREDPSRLTVVLLGLCVLDNDENPVGTEAILELSIAGMQELASHLESMMYPRRSESPLAPSAGSSTDSRSH